MNRREFSLIREMCGDDPHLLIATVCGIARAEELMKQNGIDPADINEIHFVLGYDDKDRPQ